ncbi:MAG TPA: AraC family transcriptional regulator [Polyangiales bacterium]|nr:AraC family transcriptional regulator [Polyangiales bacterium]
MQESYDTTQLCFSARLIAPFVLLLRKLPGIPPEVLDPLDGLDPDARLPIASVHELLAGAIHLTGDPDIGLKAAREIKPGMYGALEYAARSAATWGDAASTVGRYMRLVNDSLRFSVREHGTRALIQLDSVIELPRASADFQSAAFHISSLNLWSQPFQPEFEVWFMHPEPPDRTQYELTFPGGVFHFEAPFNGFTTPSSYLDLPVQTADPNLHVLIRKHAEAMLAELPRAKSLTERVRTALADRLPSGAPTLYQIARQFGMSERTLARHLEDEGTNFKALFEDLRRRLALRYVGSSELPFSEIACLLGFSQAAAFHRAFRRWTGRTPLDYRRAP